MNDSLIDEWSREYGFTETSSCKGSAHTLHACIIGGASTFIHSPQLPIKDPSYFDRLKHFATQQGIQLRACKRRAKDAIQHESRRRSLAPLILLTLGIAGSPITHAETQKQHLKFSADSTIEVKRYTPSHSVHNHSIFRGDATDNSHNNPVAKSKIKNVLLDKLTKTKNTPTGIQEDIEKMADYYSGFEKVTELIISIENEDWRLQFAPHTFQTTVEGSQLSVDSLTVYFDPRSGAKLQFYDRCSDAKPFCVASPADALLHELIHVQSISQNPDRFIEQGGMSQTIYPYKHEYETIRKENSLYKSMSTNDNTPRPQRNEHSGRHVLVSCVTCLE